jgi:DNA-binding transcriptional MerR regulator
MSDQTPSLWNLDELSHQVALALSNGYQPPSNGQVRAVPDVRTIRYYTAMGLVDRPSAMDGRTGLYGWRHLLQLVAIKRLQAAGLQLADIQQRMLGLTNGELATLAGLPEQRDDGPCRETLERRDPTFWKTAPAPVGSAPASSIDAAGRAVDGIMQGIPLAPGLSLLLEPRRTMNEADLAAIRQAALPLVALLENRQLWQSGDR